MTFPDESTPEFETLLVYLKESRGFDFTGYKRASLARRIHKRMEFVGISDVSDYLDRLQVDPDEGTQLFNFVLINVTSFFRDPQIWDFLGDEVVPRIIESNGPDEPIRVWIPGCSSGEEPYSAAMLFAERLGTEEYRRRVKIYATDVDADALAQARAATYTARQVEGVPPPLLNRYFERGADDAFTLTKDIRPAVIFGRHDLVQDAPISRVDLLMCRNTLMYLNSETQTRVMEHFYFGLKEGGFLVLGKAEMLFTQLRSFLPLDLKRRVFVKDTDDEDAKERLLLMAHAGHEQAGSISNHVRGRESAFELGSVGQIVIDRNGALVQANARARLLFGLAQQDLGRPLQDLELSYKPVELRSHLQALEADRKPIRVRDVQWQLEGAPLWLEMELGPLADQGGRLLGASIAFHEVTRYHDLQQELEQSNQELETAMEELQSTNEELETTNEELQSTNEELETTNEELQSTNEELETMNEELQSTNEELETINDELQQRTDELNDVNAFLESVLGGLTAAVVVVDRELVVTAWNESARELWGLSSQEVHGQHLLNLDIGLPVEKLRPATRSALAGELSSLELDAVNRRGKPIKVALRFAPLASTGSDVRGAIVMMEVSDA